MEDNAARPRVFHSSDGVFAIQQKQWKLIQGTKGPGQLYNLNLDPCEQDDLWDQYPERVLGLTQTLESIKSQSVEIVK